MRLKKFFDGGTYFMVNGILKKEKILIAFFQGNYNFKEETDNNINFINFFYRKNKTIKDNSFL